MNANEFADYVMSQAPAEHKFSPMAHYDSDGDCIEFLFSDENFYAERIDNLVTVYYGQETKEIVGSFIKGVRKFIREILQRTPGFKIEIRDGRIKLTHLFTAKLWSEAADPQGTVVRAYQKLRQVAEEANAEADVGDLALT